MICWEYDWRGFKKTFCIFLEYPGGHYDDQMPEGKVDERQGWR